MHPKLKFPPVIFLVAFSLRISSASQIKLGEVLPEVNLTEFGELNLERANQLCSVKQQ